MLSPAILFGAITLICVIGHFAWFAYNRFVVRTVYQGEASISLISLLGGVKRQQKQLDYVQLFVPNAEPMVVAVRAERLSQFKDQVVANVTVKIGRGWAKAFLQSIIWPGESAEESNADQGQGALAIATLYLLAGFALIDPACKFFTTSSYGHLVLLSPVLLLAASGYILGKQFNVPKTKENDHSAKTAGISFSKGAPPVFLPLILALSISIFCFWTPTILMLIPGIGAAMAVGTTVAWIEAYIRRQS